MSPALQPLTAFPEQLLTVAEVAAKLRVSRATIYKLVAADALKTVRVGESIRFNPVDVAAFAAGSSTRSHPRRNRA